MHLPKDIYKPFFSYGIFRPGEIAFQIISDYVDLNRIEKRTIKGQLKLRDGILIYDQKGTESIHGYLLCFREGMEKHAYERIVGLEPDKYYTWNESLSIFRNEFNILFGKSTNKGVDEEKGLNDPAVWDKLFESIWDDPFIINGLNLLEQYSKMDFWVPSLYNDLVWHEEANFNDYLKYQMFYIFLCSILERMMFLNGGFGATPGKQLELFSADKTLGRVISSLVEVDGFTQFKKPFLREIYPTNDPKKSVKWIYEDSKIIDPSVALEFYYQLRSNITHRGKSGIEKFSALREAFGELRYILRKFWTEKKSESQLVKDEIDYIIKKRNE